MSIYSRLASLKAKCIVNMKKKTWVQTGNVKYDETVMFFPETVIISNLGNITIDSGSCIRGALEIQREGGLIKIGKNCYIGDHSRIWSACKIVIGNNVLIAHNCNIFDNDTHPTDFKERREDANNIIRKGIRTKFDSLKSSSVVIGDDVWIGCNTTILKGVAIGDRSIVAAGSVVLHDFPEDVMIAGNPAKVIKSINKNAISK